MFSEILLCLWCSSELFLMNLKMHYLKYYKIGYHVYADDTQLYFSFNNNWRKKSKVNFCLSDIRRWMYTYNSKLLMD